MTYPASGDFTCDAGQDYLYELNNRRKKEVDELAALTGWNTSTGASYIREYNKYLKRGNRENLRNETSPAIEVPKYRKYFLMGALVLLIGFILTLSKGNAVLKT